MATTRAEGERPAPDFRVRCSSCGKSVSNAVVLAEPEPLGLVVRAWVECPECIECRETAEPNAHTLTLEFGRYLTAAEWREVYEGACQLPYVQHLRADAVRVPTRAICKSCGATFDLNVGHACSGLGSA